MNRGMVVLIVQRVGAPLLTLLRGSATAAT